MCEKLRGHPPTVGPCLWFAFFRADWGTQKTATAGSLRFYCASCRLLFYQMRRSLETFSHLTLQSELLRLDRDGVFDFKHFIGGRAEIRTREFLFNFFMFVF